MYIHIYHKYVHVVWGVCVYVYLCTCVIFLPCYLTVSLHWTHSEFILIINFSHIPYDVF